MSLSALLLRCMTFLHSDDLLVLVLVLVLVAALNQPEAPFCMRVDTLAISVSGG
ncbi:hypothetical protein [Pokkaliibacter plantistimulans]|uniref:hypothetical protein n=1 Tax=Pokkaliibacter plantistimulans TaxID=1635171 RepID=UPI00140296D1|nr:hypothetical protein [Pokkaliibacter plantistimulans]